MRAPGPVGKMTLGQYGPLLVTNKGLICRLIEKLVKELKLPVTSEIRCIPKEEQALDLAKSIQ